MCETPFAHENSRMTFDFVYVKNGQFYILKHVLQAIF